MFPSAGPGGRPQLLRVLRAEPGRPGGCRGRGRLHGHGGLEGLGPGAVNSNDLIILYVLNKLCLPENMLCGCVTLRGETLE